MIDRRIATASGCVYKGPSRETFLPTAVHNRGLAESDLENRSKEPGEVSELLNLTPVYPTIISRYQ